MTPTPEALPPLPAETPAEKWLRSRYGAYRGHFAWRELEEAFTAGRASIAMGEGEPVYWEWRHMGSHPDAVDFGQWSEWKRVQGRSPIHTAEDELNDFRAYIARGQKYELRALYTAQPAPVAPTVPAKLPQGFATSRDGDDWRVTLIFKDGDDAKALAGYMDLQGVPAANTRSPAAPVSDERLHPVAKRRVYDAIRSAYDLGYNDARNARAVPGDGAPGYEGRNVEADHGGALLHALDSLRPAPAQPMSDEQSLPVAQWQKRHPKATDGIWQNTGEHDAKWWRYNAPGWEIRALCDFAVIDAARGITAQAGEAS